ncbi:MAG: hypothetical protein IJ326_05420 [Lachnospiraceae bacterium]|nr:hypothetical protein [Lachnospiraceae bacterium]
MKKARLHFTPLEMEYIKKYKETDDTTRQKLREQGVDIAIYDELVQLRYDTIWLRGQRDHLQQRCQELEQSLYEFQSEIPFADVPAPT